MEAMIQDPMKIDVSIIPSSDIQNLAFTFLAAVKNYYEDPENEKRFQDWLQKKNDH